MEMLNDHGMWYEATAAEELQSRVCRLFLDDWKGVDLQCITLPEVSSLLELVTHLL